MLQWNSFPVWVVVNHMNVNSKQVKCIIKYKGHHIIDILNIKCVFNIYLFSLSFVFLCSKKKKRSNILLSYTDLENSALDVLKLVPHQCL